jgi:predicted alpha/beta-hydrolase family hydrolase
MLFLSGTRDELADMNLLKPVCQKLGKLATLHCLDTADHGFKTLKRSRTSEEDVFVEMARIVRDWASRLPLTPARSRPRRPSR